MPAAPHLIPPGERLDLHSLITPTVHGISSRILAKTSGGSPTLFAFDAGQGLTEHTSPFDALVMVLEGALTLTIGGTPVSATPGTVVRMPAVLGRLPPVVRPEVRQLARVVEHRDGLGPIHLNPRHVQH